MRWFAEAADVADWADAGLLDAGRLERDPSVRRLLEAGCLVRRVTRSGLAAMVPEHFSDEAFVALRALPFVETAADGLVVHETVRAAIAASLRALDPERHQVLRRAAWTCLRAEVAGAARAQRCFHAPEGPAVELVHTDCGEAFDATLACDQCTSPLRGAEVTVI